jgi:N-sulfoglucosamine sulfohydrolase
MNKIPRRQSIKMFGALGASLANTAFLGEAAQTAGKPSLPNFIVYMSDDHGMLFSEPYGATNIHTPNLARFAAEGMKFTHAFNTSPSCGPSRTSMLTGLWPARHGAEPNHKPPKPGVEGLPAVLKSLGYETACFGKVAHNDWAKYYNFDVVHGPNVGATDTDAVEQFLAERDKSKPLCLFFGSHYPHVPWVKNEGYDPANVKLPPTLVDTPETRRQATDYYTSVSHTDALAGRFRALVQKHVPGDSLFIYTTDHGAQWPFAKWDLYDAGIRVPFIAVWPGKLKPGSTNDAIICLPDLLPTLIELAGGRAPDGLDGRSFAGLLRGKTTQHRDRVFNTQSGDGDYNVYPIRSLRTREWKYIWNLHPEFQHHTHDSRHRTGNGVLYWRTWLEEAKTNPAARAVVKRFVERPAEELYDLKADPYEMKNLAGDPEQASRLASMRAELKAWMKQQGDTQTVFGKPLLIGEPVTLLPEAAG